MMSAQVRVLQVLGGLEAGGAESFVMNLYRSVDKEQVQFDFIKHVEHKGVFEDEIAKMGGEIFCCPQYTGKNHLPYCKWWNAFFIDHPEYHVIHGHVRSTAAIYLKIAKKHGLVTIAHSHSTSNGSGLSAVVKNMMQLPIRNTADYLFACSDNAGEWLYGKNVLERPNYRMIPNGIDLNRFAFDAEKRKQMRQKLSIPEKTFVIGHVGRFTATKNHKFLVELFAEHSKENSDSKLLLVGDGELRGAVEQQCVQLGLRDSVIMVGSKTNTEDYYQVMDVFVFPSLWEGLGIAAIEAQKNGLACLLSNNLPREAIVNNSTIVLPLDTMSNWVRELERKRNEERPVNLNEKLKKFDIHVVAYELQNFYIGAERYGIQRK